jgi:hypothetical protein
MESIRWLNAAAEQGELAVRANSRHWQISDDIISGVLHPVNLNDSILSLEKFNKHKDGLKGDPWYALVRRRDVERMLSPKLVTTLSNGGQGNVGIDSSGDLIEKGGGMGCCVVPRKPEISLAMLLGVLNSSIVYDYLKLRARHVGGEVSYQTRAMEKLPVPAYCEATAPIYLRLAERVRELLKEKDEERRKKLEAEIDALVIELYRAVKGKAASASKELCLLEDSSRCA